MIIEALEKPAATYVTQWDGENDTEIADLADKLNNGATFTNNGDGTATIVCPPSTWGAPTWTINTGTYYLMYPAYYGLQVTAYTAEELQRRYVTYPEYASLPLPESSNEPGAAGSE